MRAVLQRVSSAAVRVEGDVVGEIAAGYLVLVAIHRDDTPQDGEWMIRKLLAARLFEDDQGKMGRSIVDIAGGLLVVSQFTLYGEMRKGTRPDFTQSMPGAEARVFYESWLRQLRTACPPGMPIAEGRFATEMKVSLVNDGPVTLILDSR